MRNETFILKQEVYAYPVAKSNLKTVGHYLIFQKKCDFIVCPMHIGTS